MLVLKYQIIQEKKNMIFVKTKCNYAMKSIVVGVALAMMGLMVGCATHIRGTAQVANQAPREELSNFQQFEIKQVKTLLKIARDNAN